jgi:hypothetical protein
MIDVTTTTPRRRTLEWLRGHPQVLARDESDAIFRLSQRFALASFYYATSSNASEPMSSSWIRSDGWLNYSVHECNWYGCGCSYFEEEGGE